MGKLYFTIMKVFLQHPALEIPPTQSLQKLTPWKACLNGKVLTAWCISMINFTWGFPTTHSQFSTLNPYSSKSKKLKPLPESLSLKKVKMTYNGYLTSTPLLTTDSCAVHTSLMAKLSFACPWKMKKEEIIQISSLSPSVPLTGTTSTQFSFYHLTDSLSGKRNTVLKTSSLKSTSFQTVLT